MHRDDPRLTLPSSWRLARLVDRVHVAAEGLGTREAATLLDALGDLSLALARRPVQAWAAPPERMALHMEQAGWRSGVALLEVAIARGLWVALPNGTVRPADPEIARTLAAMRMASTEDAAGDLDQRLRGDLLDVVPMALALVEDPGSQAELMHLLSEREGPFEDALELGVMQLALALGWGATCAEDLRRGILNRCLEWTSPGGGALHRVAGMAALAQEARGGPFADEVISALTDRIEELLPESDDSPAGYASLEATLCSFAAGFEDNASTLKLFVISSGFEASLLARVLPLVWPPGDLLDGTLISLAEQARNGDATAPFALARLGEATAHAEGLVQAALKAAREQPEDEHAASAAVAAAHATAQWPSVSELTAHLLARLTVAPVAFDVRVACARALAAHSAVTASSRATLMQALEAALSRPDPMERGAAVAALLLLGTDDPGVASLAVGLVADGAPADLFGELLSEALGRHPALVLGLREVWLLDEPELQLATLSLLEPLAQRLHGAAERGPFDDGHALSHRVRMELLEMVLPLVGRLDDPEIAEPAAILSGWLGRGDEDVADTLRLVRDAVDNPAHHGMRGILDLALGAAGVVSEALVRRVAEDVAHGDPALAASAAAALAVMGTHIDALDPADDLVPIFRARLEYEGPQQAPIRDLLIAMALLPVLSAD